MKYFRKYGELISPLEKGVIFKIELDTGTIKFELNNKIYIMSLSNAEHAHYYFSIWAEKGAEELLLLRRLTYDVIEIADYFIESIRPIFVKSLILFLQSFKHFDPLFSARLKDLIEYYFNLCKNAKSINIKENIFAAEHYLELCMNDDDQDWFDLHPNGLNREEQVERIADFLIEFKKDDENKDHGKLDLLLQKARSWLMLRYEIDKAAYVQFFKHPNWLKVFQVLPEVCGLIIFFSLFTIRNDFWDMIKPPILHISSLFSINNFGLLTLYIIFIMEGIKLVLKIKSGRVQTQVFMPRVASGVIVGYFAIMNELMWYGIYNSALSFSSPNQTNWIIFAARIIIPLIAIYIYLLIEMSNVKGIGNIRPKALRILMRGYAYSLMIGVIMCDIFGENLIRTVSERFMKYNQSFTCFSFKGIFGSIYPEAVLLLSPLALFIGVFFHLLWEDKAVTEKI
ncbi:MAG: hypothetical protein Q7J16_11285 [Candidatus Cloacimonadales bacterium]|nr:hypothetical protein [Candidatus Cloacimonadales bacterium]